ncbi:ribosome-associated translation inhibitor RaiA [Nitrospinae bacterium AH_259_B05_G02_I21]|nr:ribosome-associated translation inhibitor RaiA [Nitrospinae bacterium AH_259_B05_G02_I21]MDA2931605.1 ribosome-associated translation inhibitor RaiA [Nitrospinae bacterium AH-259-F20]
MQVSVTARRLEMTPELKTFAEEKVRKITKHLDRVIDAHIVLSVEKYRHAAEVTINVNGFLIHGEEVSSDIYTSIEQVMHKIDAQIKKYKSKLIKKGRHQ